MPITELEVLEFWFGRERDEGLIAKQQSGLWWSKDPATDIAIKARFENTVLAAQSGLLDNWNNTASGSLALVLLTDQLPRNMYRDTPESFAFDSLARNWCKQGLQARVDLKLPPIQRVFFYLPLEHSESRDDQRLSVQLFGELASSVTAELKSTFDWYLEFARRHAGIIERFERFPHRNQILQRASTAEELAFLQQPGSAF